MTQKTGADLQPGDARRTDHDAYAGALSRVDQTRIRTGQPTTRDWARISSTMGILLEKRNMYIDDSSGLDADPEISRAAHFPRARRA